MRPRIVSILCCSVAFATPFTIHGQSGQTAATAPAYRARVMGVYDATTGEPLEGVKVMDMLARTSATTTKTGTLALVFLPDGGGLVRIQKLGYQKQTLPVAISPADTAPVTITLTRVTELAPVVTKADSGRRFLSPALNGFEERRKTEHGYYLSEDDLRKNDGRPLASLLQTKPSVIVQPGRSGAEYLLRAPQCPNGGPPQVYLDGVPLVDPPRAPADSIHTNVTTFRVKLPPGTPEPQPFNLSTFLVSDLAGVEWYPTNDLAPIEFGHTSNRCGTLLLWTRER